MLTDIIKRLAEESGKTTRQISDEMQVSEKTLKRMLSGAVGTPSLHTFVNFLRVCGADIAGTLNTDVVAFQSTEQICRAEIPEQIADQTADEALYDNHPLTKDL